MNPETMLWVQTPFPPNYPSHSREDKVTLFQSIVNMIRPSQCLMKSDAQIIHGVTLRKVYSTESQMPPISRAGPAPSEDDH